VTESLVGSHSFLNTVELLERR